jgi:hypothetical protein
VKKALVLFVIFIFPMSLWAQEEEAPNDDSRIGIITWEEEQEPPPKKRYAIKNRRFEISLFNFDVSLSNSFIAADYVIRNPIDMMQTGKLFKDSVSINLNDFLRGFQFNFDTVIDPLSLNFNWKDKWGFGLDIGHVNVTGNLLLSGNLLSVNEAKNDKFGAGGAVFVDCGIPVFFHYNEFKIKIRPSVFLPVVYTEPNIRYSYRKIVDEETGDSAMRLQVNYDMRVYSVVGLQGFKNNDFGDIGQDLQDNAWGIARNNLGYDFSLGVEYPWYDWLDVGVDIVNIPVPFANASLNHYMQIDGEAFFDASKIDIGKVYEDKKMPEDAYGYPKDFEIKYKNGSVEIYRPFTMLFYAKYRPNESQIFSLIPSLGFSISRLYAQLGSIEGGLSARCDLSNIFITTIGINYNDRRWKNSLDFILNLRAFEFDFGISFQSSDFVKSFQGAGLGVAVGFKFGW